MLIPVLLGMPAGEAHSEHVQHMASLPPLGASAGAGLVALGVHTLAMLAAAGAVALVVYEWAGLAFLRRGWINVDLVWVVALIGAGVILSVMALR